MLTLKQIDQKIRAAFLPFRCAVEFGNYDAKLRFKVFDHSRKGIVEVSKMPVMQARDEKSLMDLLIQVRCGMQDKGYALKTAI